MMIKIYTDRLVKSAVIAAVCGVAAVAQQQPQQVQTVQVQPVQAQTQTVQPVQPQAQELDPDWGAAMDEDAVDVSGKPLTAGVQDPASVARYQAEIQGGVRRGTELSAEALASAPYLFFERGAKDGHVRPGIAKLEPSKERAAYQRFDRVMVRPSGKTAFKAGDTVDVVKNDGLISFKGRSAQLVTRVGRAVVEERVGKRLVIRLHEMWGIISGGESIVPTTRFESVYCDNLVKPDVEIRGTVMRRIESTVTPYMHQYLIIDKGENDGVKIGDFFRVKERKPEEQLSEELLEAQVVNVTPVSATLVIHKLFKNGLNAGDHAYISRRPVQTQAASAQAQ